MHASFHINDVALRYFICCWMQGVISHLSFMVKLSCPFLGLSKGGKDLPQLQTLFPLLFSLSDLLLLLLFIGDLTCTYPFHLKLIDTDCI